MTDADPFDVAEPGAAAAALWRRVFELAEKGRYSTSPNPRVGAVVVDDGGRIVGEGFHERAGGPHAELGALDQAGENARGATLFVNLEPCAHYGRTLPCTEAILASGIRRVLCSIADADLRTAGRGFKRLRDRGVDVEVGALAAEAGRLNESFLVSLSEKRPFVHARWGASLDGKIATRSGDSRWITSEKAREDSMRLREEYDAILVGAGTVIADNPLLTRRLGLNRSIVPHRRIVLDGALRAAPGAHVFAKTAGTEAMLVTAEPAGPANKRLAPFQERGVRVLSLPAGREKTVDLSALLAELHRMEIRSLLVEGGGQTIWSFLSAGLVDRVTAYVAPLLIGGERAPSPLSGAGFAKLSDAVRLEEPEVTPLGGNVKLTARVLRAISS